MANDDNGRRQALAQLESVREMVAALKAAQEIESGNFDWEAEAERLGFALTSEDEQLWEKEGKQFETAEDACRSVEEYLSEDEARQRIEEDALSIEVRDGWRSPGAKSDGAEEFRILLCTGGPAVQIRGTFGAYSEPDDAELEYQDWFTPWTRLSGEDVPDDMADVLLAYARVFYWGE